MLDQTSKTQFYDKNGQIIGTEFGFGSICVQIGKCLPPAPGIDCRKADYKTEFFDKDGRIIGWKIVDDHGYSISEGECPPPPKKPSRAKRT